MTAVDCWDDPADRDRYEKAAEEVYSACRVSDTLFVMNPYLAQQNFYSQQLRALALADALKSLHLPHGRRNVAIVGAGISGRTLAAALVSVGASVTIFEARERDFERYRDAIHRELHPNIIFWPVQEPMPVTALPFLNWAQSAADHVVEELTNEWKRSFAKKVAFVHGEVTHVAHDANGVTITLADGTVKRKDLCILATGFRSERALGTLASPSYWSTDAVAVDNQSVLVSGSGDGGLIDVLSPLLGTKVTRVAHKLAIALSNSPLKEDICKVEADRTAKQLPKSRDSADSCTFYETLQVNDEAAVKIEEARLSDQQRAGRSVTFVYQGTSAYSFTAAPINKVLLSYFTGGDDRGVKRVKGALVCSGAIHSMTPDGGVSVSLDPPCGYDKIIVRHGADPAAAQLLDPSEVDQLKDQGEQHAGAAAICDYNRALYRWTSGGMGRSGVQLSHMETAVRRALADIGRIYDLDIVPGKILEDCFTDRKPVEVELAGQGDKERAEELRLFPLKIGPAIVRLKPRNFSRNAPYEQ